MDSNRVENFWSKAATTGDRRGTAVHTTSRFTLRTILEVCMMFKIDVVQSLIENIDVKWSMHSSNGVELVRGQHATIRAPRDPYKAS